MRPRLRRQENEQGEWSVLDMRRGYRICRFNHEHHAGTHVHFPETGEILAHVDLESPQEAEAVMRLYHERHEGFDPDRLKETVTEWRSASDAD